MIIRKHILKLTVDQSVVVHCEHVQGSPCKQCTDGRKQEQCPEDEECCGIDQEHSKETKNDFVLCECLLFVDYQLGANPG
jgi:hypothetical protein